MAKLSFVRAAQILAVGIAAFVVADNTAFAQNGRVVGNPVAPKKVKGDPEKQKSNPSPVKGSLPDVYSSRNPKQAPAKKTRPVDTRLQSTELSGIDGLTNPIVNIAGIDSNSNPPDTVGDVGKNHYVQMVNATQYQVWDKTGTSLLGPVSFGALWPNLDDCNSSLGDPIVVYDHLADRWLLSQFARRTNSGPFFMCIAISQTPDPSANTWFLYTIETPDFPDYPKFGVWPDGYYMSSYEGSNLGVFVFDRSNMLLGNAAGYYKYTIGSLGTGSVRDTRILPADLDGPAPPPGTPNYFVRTVDDQQDPNPAAIDRVEVYEFKVNWAAASSSFNLVQTLAAADGLIPFDIMTCNRESPTDDAFRACIPQPDSDDTIDALSNRPMMQLKFRVFDGTLAMVFNQTIDIQGTLSGATDEVAGIRWYDLRKSGASWTFGNQGTFGAQPIGASSDPQFLHRWMGSMAIDKDGNAAIGYSIVNSNDTNGMEVYPGIRFTGRLAADPPGIMAQGEKNIFTGTSPSGNNSGGNTPQRWGDYSALSVDPVDDCTFWFTTHTTNGVTSIASFRFSTCGTDLKITKTDSPDPVTAGTNLRYDILVQNQGPVPAAGVVVEDVLPTGLSHVSNTAGCTVASQTVTCLLGAMADGASRSLTINTLVSPSAILNGISTVSNTATVKSSTGETDSSDNTSTASTLITASADLRLVKTCKPDTPAAAGATAFCSIVVDNLGPSTAQNVQVVDDIVSNSLFTVVGATSDPVGSCVIANPAAAAANKVTCSAASLNPGGKMTIIVSFTTTAAGDINDTATVTATTTDPNPANNQGTGRVSFVPGADLRVLKTSLPAANVIAGTNIVWNVSVTNLGPSSATNVVLRDTLPAEVENVSYSASVGSCQGGIPGNPAQPVTCTLGELANGASATISITAKVKAGVANGFILNNNAAVVSATPDANNANNSATSFTSVRARADLAIAKTSDKSSYKPSTTIAYTVNVTNLGESDAKAVIVKDTLPPTKQALYLSNTGGCTLSGAILTCNLGDMLVGTSKSFNVYMTVKGSRGDVVNRVDVTSSTGDDVAGNNTSTRIVTIGK